MSASWLVLHADIVDVRHDYSIESGAPGRADPRCRSKVQVACAPKQLYGLKSKRGGSVPSKRLLEYRVHVPDMYQEVI